MNTLTKLKLETDLQPVVSAYKLGYKSLALKRFNDLTLREGCMYWEVLALKAMVAEQYKLMRS